MTTPEQSAHHVTTESKEGESDGYKTLKYHLLGPSLTKAGQDQVDQNKVSEIIYNASKGSKYFNREEVRDKVLTQKIEQILARKQALEKLDLTHDLRNADRLITELDLTRDLTQYIVHVDCDAFYATVELLTRPDLKDKPFAVGAGVLTTCNYVARQFGCRSGMAGFVAKKLCPQLVTLKPDFTKYTSKAHEVREVLVDYDPRFESASIDEAYLNITEYCLEHRMDPAEAVEQMRREVAQKTGITVSAGIAANGKLAKICSNLNKPNGQYVLPNDRNEIMSFMRELPTRKVNGIGRVLERELLEIGIKTCGDIYSYRQYLYQLFGEKTFEFLMQVYLGLGRTRIQPAEEYERKSVGTESTFREMSDPQKLREQLRWTADELEKDMKRAACKGRTLCLKVKLHTFEVYTRQVVTPRAIHLSDDLYNFSLPMLTKLEKDMPGMRLRLMGLRCTHLVSAKRPDTMAFFGFRPRSTYSETSGQVRHAGEEGHESHETGGTRTPAELTEDQLALPDEFLPTYDEEVDPCDLEDAEPHLREDPYRHHGKEITPNPKKKATKPGEQEDEADEWWECPICSRPQAASEREFNEHIDLCLSRQTIREAVQEDSTTGSPGGGGDDSSRRLDRSATPEVRKTKLGEKRKGRPVGATGGRGRDPKQRKLTFG